MLALTNTGSSAILDPAVGRVAGESARDDSLCQGKTGASGPQRQQDALHALGFKGALGWKHTTHEQSPHDSTAGR